MSRRKTAPRPVISEGDWYDYQERAGIMEYDCHMSREDAERAAWAIVFRDRLPFPGDQKQQQLLFDTGRPHCC